MSTIAAHVDQAAENIRAANHATHGGRLNGPTAAVVVGNLAELTGRLPQLLDHLRRSLRRADPCEHYDDRIGADVATTLRDASDYLDETRHLAEALRDQLNEAHNHLGHIGRHLQED